MVTMALRFNSAQSALVVQLHRRTAQSWQPSAPPHSVLRHPGGLQLLQQPPQNPTVMLNLPVQVCQTPSQDWGATINCQINPELHSSAVNLFCIRTVCGSELCSPESHKERDLERS